jgi:PAS domain-containing protein
MDIKNKTKEELVQVINVLLAENSSLKTANENNLALRKQNEQSLDQMRINYSSFADSFDEFLFVLDEHANIILVNSNVTERLGYSKENLTGKRNWQDTTRKICGRLFFG